MGTTTAKNSSLDAFVCWFTNPSSLDFEDHTAEEGHHSFRKYSFTAKSQTVLGRFFFMYAIELKIFRERQSNFLTPCFSSELCRSITVLFDGDHWALESELLFKRKKPKTDQQE